MKPLQLFLKKLIIASLVVFVSTGTAYATDNQDFGKGEPTAEGMVVDAVIVRPVMIAVTVIGTVTFVLTSPFSLLGGNIDDAAEKLVYQPAKYTFVRPLGTFEEDYGGYGDDED